MPNYVMFPVICCVLSVASGCKITETAEHLLKVKPPTADERAIRDVGTHELAQKPVDPQIPTRVFNQAFWSRFKDPNLAPLLEKALEGSLEARLAKLELERTKINAAATLATLRPQFNGIGANVGTGTQFQNRENIGPPLFKEFRYGLSAGFTYDFDLWKQKRFRYTSARLEQRAAAYLLQAQRVTLATDVARMYFQIKAIQEQFTLAQDAAQIAQTRYKLSGLDEKFHAKALQDLREAEAQVLRLSYQRDLFIDSLGAIIGDDAFVAERLEGQGFSIGTNLPNYDKRALTTSLQNRPDLLTDLLALVSTIEKTRALDLEQLPQMKATVGLSTGARLVGGTHEERLFESLRTSFNVTVTHEILKPRKVRDAIKLNDLTREEALLKYENRLKESQTDVREALLEQSQAQQQEVQAEQALARSRVAITRAQQEKADMGALELERIAANIALLAARMARVDNALTLYKLVGPYDLQR